MLFLILCVTALSAATEQPDYVGSQTCATCHKAIYDAQAKTAMANTWRSNMSVPGRLKFDESNAGAARDPMHFEIRPAAGGNQLEFAATGLGKDPITAPVTAMIGGKRHGISFLLTLDKVGSFSLDRPALIEARYASGRLGPLVLSPGFPKELPENYEDALGRVTSPTFERRCLTCHGQPGTLGAGKQGGVRCESCHGPASEHIRSLDGINNSHQLVKPASLKGSAGLEVCAQCHSGLSSNRHWDPMPEELIVASQSPALRHSECFIQSGEALTCTTCHDPHEDSPAVSPKSVTVCLGCHSLSAPQHAAICPINRTDGCLACHMPNVDSDSFHLTDHWIRVHPESGMKANAPDPTLRTQVIPKQEYLRLIAVDSEDKRTAVRERLAKGEPFNTVAHDLSADPSAGSGGYVGNVTLSDMDPKLAAAAAHLPMGADSEFVQTGNRWVILHRLPRDFRWQADQLFLRARDLHDRGDRAGAVDLNRQALQIYPYFLRSLVFMGVLLGESGKAERAADVLRFAAQSYPQDPFTQFNLALTLGNQPASQIEAFRRALELDPDMVAIYQSLGAALFSSGDPKAAIETFLQGLQIDPLSAVLYYDLGLALQNQGDTAGATRALSLAAKLDPEIATRHKASK